MDRTALARPARLRYLTHGRLLSLLALLAAQLLAPDQALVNALPCAVLAAWLSPGARLGLIRWLTSHPGDRGEREAVRCARLLCVPGCAVLLAGAVYGYLYARALIAVCALSLSVLIYGVAHAHARALGRERALLAAELIVAALLPIAAWQASPISRVLGMGDADALLLAAACAHVLATLVLLARGMGARAKRRGPRAGTPLIAFAREAVPSSLSLLLIPTLCAAIVPLAQLQMLAGFQYSALLQNALAEGFARDARLFGAFLTYALLPYALYLPIHGGTDEAARKSLAVVTLVMLLAACPLPYLSGLGIPGLGIPALGIPALYAYMVLLMELPLCLCSLRSPFRAMPWFMMLLSACALLSHRSPLLSALSQLALAIIYALITRKAWHSIGLSLRARAIRGRIRRNQSGHLT